MSNFLQLNRLVELLSIKQGKDLDSIDMEHRMTIINTLMYINTHLINEIYHKFTNKVGIHDDQAPLIAMDNELVKQLLSQATVIDHSFNCWETKVA